MESADDIFLRAREITDAPARATYLVNACGDDHELRDRVERMLRDADAAQGIFERSEKSAGVERKLIEGPGTTIGRYKLLEKIGEGGMGVVYMAEQREPVVRKVALKIIKAGMDTRQVVAWFGAERQALALMDHPNIARVLDGGETDSGRPYFVMDLVQGLPVTQFCDEAKLSTRDRLELFLDVCSAIQHAHQKGIIHRDIKPTNILVTLHADKPVPKVIDFGIAKATQGRLTDKTVFTQFQHFIGTPAYMSPEQASLSGLDIDTRSDIYGLGVLLYELLTGKTPFDGKELLKAGLDEMRRTIREKEAPRPSTRLSTLQGEDVLVTARRRGTDALKLIHQVREDLDWIVMKCLEKDRARRYESASGLEVDLKRHLNNEPVAARPPSTGYRIQKLIRRNKVAVAATMSVVAALIAGTAIASWQAIRARRAEQAQAQARELAERRLEATLDYADRVASRDVGLELWSLIGAANISEALTTNTVRLIEQLRAEEEDSPKFRYILGRLHVQLALKLGWPRGNSAWDPEAGLKAATNAIRLLQSADSQQWRDDRAHQLALAEQIAGTTSLFLNRPDDALAHQREMSRWARSITNSSSWAGKEALRMEYAARFSAGAVLFRAGRVEEALTNYFLPRLAEAKARGVNPDSRNRLETGPLAQSHWRVAQAYDRLGRKEEALTHCREALPYYDVMVKRAPNNAEFANDRTVMLAQLGAAHLALYQPEGLDRLNEALDSAKNLAKRDPANVGFVLTEIAVRRYSVHGLTAWADDRSATEAQRRERLEQAQAHLDRADKLVERLRAESARQAVRFDLEPARAGLATAKANLQ
jgi:serine/threonine protein kinase